MELLMMVCFIYCFLIGMCVASFMNVVIDRVPRGENFVSGRSRCDSCGKVIAWYDLIPVASYVVIVIVRYLLEAFLLKSLVG